VIRRLLIANRGAIAVRIARCCRELGVETVAVYSDADAQAAHVAVADRAVHIGPATASESYLSIPRLLDAARASGADAVHPGYGFLSENAEFAAACEREGITFVGPPSQVIAAMGSKINARATMKAAGVPVVPGAAPDAQDDRSLAAAIDSIGYPVLIKAAHGGGGKGMRRVRMADERDAAIQAARREAEAAFGNGALYIERLIERPHHIEVQVFGDAEGGVVHLFERECSVQRRHQKVIEETPSPNLTPALRRKITDAAAHAAKAVGYRNAGTIECLVDLSGGVSDDAPFYFLEMNTRLQVEHGVTEQVAGVDLVRAQLLVAGGAALPWTQDALSQRGHAIEARVYAEDPANGFLPQAGTIELYRAPRMPGVRIDSGVREGDRVTVHYDPLLAKVIATAETRELARSRLVEALRAFPILGIRTNVPFLIGILTSDAFRAGAIDTGLLDRGEGPAAGAGADEPMPDEVRAALAFAAASPVRVGAAAVVRWNPWGA
jgi:acetyl-CoA carboxylase biotin carboxylase subunit